MPSTRDASLAVPWEQGLDVFQKDHYNDKVIKFTLTFQTLDLVVGRKCLYCASM